MRYFNFRKFFNLCSLPIFFVIVTACSSYKPQQKILESQEISDKTPTHTFIIAGGWGTEEANSNTSLQDKLKSVLDKADKKSTLLFPGDYTLENAAEEKNKALLEAQLAMTKDFKGKTVFVPGDHEWSSRDAKKIEWVEDYIKENKIKRTQVEPNNVCPLEQIEINDKLDMILVDSQWYIANWERMENINEKCANIPTRRRFVEELEGMIKDAREKNLLIVMHHPIYSNGTYARSFGGFSPKTVSYERYNDLRVQVSALAKELDRVTVVSGHEESLQYLAGGGVHQIISGSFGSAKPTHLSKGDITAMGGRLNFEGKFTFGERGFAVLKYYEDGSSKVEFITENSSLVFDVLEPFPAKQADFKTPTGLAKTKTVPITTEDSKLNKSAFYKFIWGKRYRPYFGVPVTADVAVLSDLYDGLTVQKAGGGHQSFSARLNDANGKEYAMRGLEKNALKFLRFKVKGIAYTQEDYEGTFAEEAVYDFFSTTHPFMQLVINPLAKSVGVNHANTQLYFLPKQPGFRLLGEAYGDQLYYIEERPNDAQASYEGYNRANPATGGKIVAFESSTDVFEKLKEDEKYSIDQKAFIRARIFDMLIGDWDRHEDQWRWAEYEVSNEEVRFIPIPRDRDAAFSKFDGIAIPLIKLILPDVRFWQSYGAEIKDVKWFMGEGNNIDRALLNKFGVDVWVEEAKFIQQQMTAEVIENAFLRLPTEVQDATSEEIKSKLKGRLENLDTFAKTYGERMNETVAIHGTNKDDLFEITRLPMGQTQVVVKRKLKDEKNTVIFDRTFNPSETKELWLYGLNDDDTFKVEGDAAAKIKIRVIGGYGEDTYAVANRSNLKVYDWKHEKSDFKDKMPSKQLTNLYETNTFHWRYFKENNNILLPDVGFRTDDGFYFGAADTYTNYGFNGNPFRYQHKLSARYFVGFEAFEVNYLGTFANIIPNWNVEVGFYGTNDSFVKNFFGFGNDTMYDDDAVEMDFNRARTQEIKASAGIVGKYVSFKGLYESFEVAMDPNRFFNLDNVNSNVQTGLKPNVFDRQNYLGGEATVAYKNQDAADFPTKGLLLSGTLGYKANIDLDDNSFGYAMAKIGLQHKLVSSGNLVFGTTVAAKTNFGGDFFFYHAPSIGGDNGLRGFRDQRFTGESYVYQTSNLKLRLKRIVTGVVPITIGVYGGFDYGRVWVENDTSNTWHTSQGGGFWLSGLNSFALNAGYFVSEEDAIIQVGFGFGF